MTRSKRPYPGPEKAPYRNGNLEEWPGYGFGSGEIQSENWKAEWRDNVPFTAELVLTGTARGRSAMRFLWKSTATGHAFPMFATDMAALAMSAEGVCGGVASGQWIVMKRGENYGIARYVP
jgi:hypothetical protein